MSKPIWFVYYLYKIGDILTVNVIYRDSWLLYTPISIIISPYFYYFTNIQRFLNVLDIN